MERENKSKPCSSDATFSSCLKSWISRALLIVMLLGTGMVALAYLRPEYAFWEAAIISPEFSAKWMENYFKVKAKRRRVLNPEQEKINLETQIIRIELEGRHYDIPMRYSYWEAFEKRGRWPTVKPGRISVGALSLSMLLPDMKPYYPEDDERWKVRGHGDRVEVTITNSPRVPDWFDALRDKYVSGQQNPWYTRASDTHGLMHFKAKGQLDDEFIPADKGRELVIGCSSREEASDFFPSCSVTSNYKPHIFLEYYYSKKHLADWREIDMDLKAVFDRFEQDANSAFLTEGK